MNVWNSACQCLTVTVQCWKQWAEAFAETLISQFVPTADSIWPHLTQGLIVPKKPLELTLFQLWASVFTQCADLFCYIASECSGYGGEFIRSQKTHLQSQKKESCAGAFHPSPPLPEDFINVSSNQTFDATSSPCLLPRRRLFESCSESIEEFNPFFKTGWMLSKHFWTKLIWNLCVCHAMSMTHMLQSASNLK